MNGERRSNPVKVLVLDDDKKNQRYFSVILSGLGYQYFGIVNPAETFKFIEKEKPQIIFLDIVLPHFNGIEILKNIKKSHPHIVIILITAYATIKTAVNAIRSGALDYIEKPVTKDQLEILLNKSKNFMQLTEENITLKNQLEATYNLDKICVKSKVMYDILDKVMRIAKTDTSVLIYGQSGTGKELIARFIHENSLRKTYPFIPVNCAALPETLLESELFGHERGAFTGAISKKRGLFEYADKGTIFLDEISGMTLSFQAKLLRFLEDFKFRRVGGNELRETNVRVICATNHDPMSAIKTNQLREDLYYRINGITIELPPLRERVEDISELINYFITQQCKINEISQKDIDKQAFDILINYSWPGNVRELKNTVQQIICLSENKTIYKKDLPEHILKATKIFMNKTFMSYKKAKEIVLSEFEVDYFKRIINLTNGNITKAAELTEVSRKSIYNILHKNNLI